MEAAPAYRERIKQDIGSIINALDLSDLHKHFLRSRWLDMLLWMDGKATRARTWHYVMRLAAIIGGVIVPALVSVNMSSAAASELIGWLTFALSLLVAMSVAVEEFFSFRRALEALPAHVGIAQGRRLAIPAAQRALSDVGVSRGGLSPFCREG